MRNAFPLYRWFRDVPISRKLYFTVGTMAVLIGLELFVLLFSLSTLSSLRAYVGGEGLWSKAEKEAVFHLYRYGVAHIDKDYQPFQQFMPDKTFGCVHGPKRLLALFFISYHL